jgi:hypothetical protein
MSKEAQRQNAAFFAPFAVKKRVFSEYFVPFGWQRFTLQAAK